MMLRQLLPRQGWFPENPVTGTTKKYMTPPRRRRRRRVIRLSRLRSVRACACVLVADHLTQMFADRSSFKADTTAMLHIRGTVLVGVISYLFAQSHLTHWLSLELGCTLQYVCWRWAVSEAKNLLAMDDGNTSDPYVTLKVGPDGKQKHQTSRKDKTVNPVWQEDFTLCVFE
jgi:hypothetical protein